MLLNPPSPPGTTYVRVDRCMQKADAWASSLWPPIALTHIQAWLRAVGLDTKLVDAVASGLSVGETAKLAEAYNPDLMIVNTSIPTIRWDTTVSEAIKVRLQNCRVAVIGIPPTIMPHECHGADFLIKGEPELAAMDLVKDLATESPTRVLEDRPVEVAELPLPDVDGLPLDAYTMPFRHERLMLIETARGCPFKCIFCVAPKYFGRRVRYRPPQKVVDEIEYFHAEHGTRFFLFWSDTFALNKRLVMEICREIRARRLDIAYMTMNRVDTLNREVLLQMKRSGCFMTSLGVESGVQKILDNARKGISVEQSEDAIRLCREVGVWSMCHVIFGLPGDSWETANHSINWIIRQNPDYIQAYCSVAYPETDFWQRASDEGWLVSTNPEDMEIDKGNTRNDCLTISHIRRLREIALKRFILRPSFMFREAFRHPAPGLVLDGLRFLSAWALQERIV